MGNRNAARHLLLVASILLCFFIYIGYRLQSPSEPEQADAGFTPEFIQVDDDPAPLRPQTAAPADSGLGGWVPSAPGGSSAPASLTPPPAALPVAPPGGSPTPPAAPTPDGAITGLIPAPPSGEATDAAPDLPPFMTDSESSVGTDASTGFDSGIAETDAAPSRSPFLPPPDDGVYSEDSSATAAADAPLLGTPGTPGSSASPESPFLPPASGGAGASSSMRPPSATATPAAAPENRSPVPAPSAPSASAGGASDEYGYQDDYEDDYAYGEDDDMAGEDDDDLGAGSQSLRMYVVRMGDTLSNIAARELGSISLADNIFLLNRDVIQDPDSLTVGTKIRLPVRDGFMSDAGTTATVSQSQPGRRPNQGIGRTHIVARGDTLSSIALQYYGASSGWNFLYEANKTIVPNPNQLSVGMELTIPPYEN